jgi:two-component sensor histidine kinase
VAVVASFGLLTWTLVAVAIISDRRAVLLSAEERTRSNARMIVAHGEAALGDADKIISAVQGQVAVWDLADEAVGQQIFRDLRDLMIGSPHISAAWIIDSEGVSRLNTWSYPAENLDVTDRPYFQRHLSGVPDPVVAGDPTPGAVTGRERFTFSRALRDEDGSLHAVVAVGIYAHQFDTLYREAATWPDARAGFYSLDGDTLARLQGPARASPEFVAQMLRNVASARFGTALIEDNDRPRLASWFRSDLHPELFATSSQTVSAALAEWKARSALMAAVAALAVLGFALFATMHIRAAEARQTASMRELAIREVHHRVKNALQLVVSMIALRMREEGEEPARAVLPRIRDQIAAIADVEDLLQKSSTLEEVEVTALLRQLCDRLQRSYAGQIRFTRRGGMVIDVARATAAATVVNELITNAMKHSEAVVEVECTASSSEVDVLIRDQGSGLPLDFDLRAGNGFGLKAALLMTDSIGGNLSIDPSAGNGTSFRLRIPASRTAETS